MIEQKDTDFNLMEANSNMYEEKYNELDAELNLKAKENNQLRKTCADIEQAMQDLYRSRKGAGSMAIEMESLKADNEHLLNLLKDTCEYADCSDNDIMKSMATARMKGSKGIKASFEANKGARGVKNQTPRAKSSSAAGGNAKLNNDWIPTQAINALVAIKDRYDGKLDDRAISAILYDLNSIWRNIMRHEVDAQKKRMGAQIQDLRRQIVAKQAFDKGELMQEISRTKK